MEYSSVPFKKKKKLTALNNPSRAHSLASHGVASLNHTHPSSCTSHPMTMGRLKINEMLGLTAESTANIYNHYDIS
jgi:hypothetical protein